ncbi:MAG TPA: M1 family aminopeptidase [Polyangiaceae bacterium]|nr:M1 family aminopeptidase [Polyangiaceae bacterium]
MWKIAAPPLVFLTLLLRCSGSTPDPTCTSECAGADRGYDATSYELIGRFDWTRQRLIATEWVTIVKKAMASNIVELDAAVDVKRVRGVDARGIDAAKDDGGGGGDGASQGGGIDLPFTMAGNLLHIDVSPLHGDGESLSFAIDYEASPSEALRPSVSRDDDPVTTRVVYTDSEPFAGMFWLPANHRPSDRAAWNIELTVGATEDVIANGTRAKDEIRGGERVVRYEMINPIPTYTMAFAAGELEHQDRTTGRVPVSVWHRRGLAFDSDEMLDLLSDAMASFEKLLGPYPWASYAVVLLPEFSGGMENTTITFAAEASGQANPGASLQAHELGHQWFGDWVTVATFDDVWIKEGMATLLAPEADRPRRDAQGSGRLFGYTFAFNPADSIRDKRLVGIAKYTSGPYTRAAWLLTQIRARVGETSFWQSLRLVLAKHALGSVGSEAFVRSFALDEGTVQKILRSLDEKRVPRVTIRTEPGPATMVTLSLHDPGETMIAPTIVTVVDGQGRPASSALVPDIPLTIPVLGGGYLAPDERDVHPEWWTSFDVSPAELGTLVPLLFPTSDAARATFAARSAAHQERAFDALLGFTAKLDMAPSAFAALYAGLDSSISRRLAEIAGCFALKSRLHEAWGAALESEIATPSLTTWSTGYANCETELPTRTFGAELANLAAHTDEHTASRLIYLSSYDYGPAATLDALAQVATQAPTLQLRDHALTRLSYQAAPGFGYTAASGEQLPRWKDFFRARLGDAKSAPRFQTVWRGVVGLADDRALALAGQKLHTVSLSDDLQSQVVCDAYAIAQGSRAEAWTEFQQAAQPWDTLGSAAKALLAAGGTGCGP